MRIIAGKARGRQIVAPEGRNTRPVTDKIREALFSIWQNEIGGAVFLDLFSGSGCMGLEAISRGASKVVMVDNGAQAVNCIKHNIKTLGFNDEPIEVLREDVFSTLKRLSRGKERFDIIYIDPPFTVDEIFEPVMEAVASARILAEGGQVVIRTLDKRSLASDFGKLNKYREKRYGISMLHFYDYID